MSPQHQLEQDLMEAIARWGFNQVLYVLVDICHHYASDAEPLPPDGPPALWRRRRRALLDAERTTRRTSTADEARLAQAWRQVLEGER
jgi:hypothetical protein